ncbi:MAG TPA: PfkB family carbohydrate kinase [Candidatus Bathyarchaeia archaeon]|nr:PfkB family carbohydrate kinase [Candidatus Bathyarchaeia archaeon]
MRERGHLRIGVYGNLTLDELERNGRRIVRPGGTALYSSLAAAYFGANVSIVSNIGRDYPREVLSRIERRGVNVEGIRVSDEKTTRFRISYVGSSRILELIHPGRKLIPHNGSNPFQSIHLGPVFSETGLDILKHARRRTRFLSIDLQGLLRRTDEKGRVRLVKRNIEPYLADCNLVKATEDEARVLFRTKSLISIARKLLHAGPEYVLISRGRRGSVLVDGRMGVLRVPSFQENKAIDPTGAGDILLGSWLATFQSIRDVRWANAVGAAFASLSMRRFGLSKFRLSRRELFQRASWILLHSRRFAP